MSRLNTFVMTLAVAAVVTACGGSKSPTAPAGSNEGAGNGAVISGSVRSGSPLLAATTGGAVSGILVTVVGTGISSGVDAAGRFTLNGVPPGDVLLKFSGGGIDATVTISRVSAAENITLSVNVDGTSVVVESEVRSTASEQQLEGRIESLPPTMDAGTLKVAGKTVKTQTGTRIERGGETKSFGDLLIGMRVHVTGTPSGSELVASVIRIQNTNTWIPVQVNGIIDSLSGDEDLFQFKVGSRLVKGDDLTGFFGSSSFSGLKDGARVEVKGQQRDGYVYAERIHVNGSDDDDDDEDQDSSASIEGELKAKTGTKPNLELTVGSTLVRTNSGTVVQRRGDVQSLDALQLGQTLHVVGTRRPDGSLDARRIQIKDDETGGEFEIEGSVGGLKGTCPKVSFGVNGFSISTDDETDFTGGQCTALKNGNKVTVEGIRQPDGSVLATKVKQ